MKFRAAIVALTMMGATVLGIAGATDADAAAVHHTRAQLYAAANIVAKEQVGGPLYARYKQSYPDLNWTKDGCSAPWYGAIIGGSGIALFKGTFTHSCDRHDFGYRNFGKARSTHALALQPTRARKNSIDSTFKSNMFHDCDTHFGGIIKAPVRAYCKATAQEYYYAVSHHGDSAFFG